MRKPEKLQPPVSGFLWFFISLFQKILIFFAKLPNAWRFQAVFGDRVKNFSVVLFFLFNSGIIKCEMFKLLETQWIKSSYNI